MRWESEEEQCARERKQQGLICATTGLVIAYGINSAQNAMMKCTSHLRLPQRIRTDMKERSRRVEERRPQPPRQEQALSGFSRHGTRFPGYGIEAFGGGIIQTRPARRVLYGRCTID